MSTNSRVTYEMPRKLGMTRREPGAALLAVVFMSWLTMRSVTRPVGLVKGALFAGWRLLRCNPWSHGGVDHAEDAVLFRRREVGQK